MKVKPVVSNIDMFELVAETEYEQCLLEKFHHMKVSQGSSTINRETGRTVSINFSLEKEREE